MLAPANHAHGAIEPQPISPTQENYGRASGCITDTSNCHHRKQTDEGEDQAPARRRRDARPFALTVLFFLAAFLTLAVMFWPYMIPYSITVANAAAPQASLSFLFWGAGLFALRVIAIYTAAQLRRWILLSTRAAKWGCGELLRERSEGRAYRAT
jgi:hypothetical protein